MSGVNSREDQWGSYEEAVWTYTQKKTFHTWSQSAVGEAALENSEPANSKEGSSRGCTGLVALDWTTSEICSNSRTLGF